MNIQATVTLAEVDILRACQEMLARHGYHVTGEANLIVHRGTSDARDGFTAADRVVYTAPVRLTPPYSGQASEKS